MKFSESAQRLSGQTALIMGWRPDEFWSATPEELACILAEMMPKSDDILDSKSVRELMAKFPDNTR